MVPYLLGGHQQAEKWFKLDAAGKRSLVKNPCLITLHAN